MCVFIVICFFFFQAEDGIRDLVRSRGLGDVYKRQGIERGKFSVEDPQLSAVAIVTAMKGLEIPLFINNEHGNFENRLNTVSYTHLTLPTSDLV